MSTSQKHQGYSVVPWYNREEWVKVYNLILQVQNDFKKEHCSEAYDMLLLWKQRMNLLPSGIEGTIFLLEALISNPELMTDQQSILIYSSAVMRFLNVCVTGRSHAKTFTRTLRNTAIPDWIVSIRHDFAHSYKLPGFGILKLAVQECFTWVVKTYWKQEFRKIKDFIIAPQSSEDVIILFKCYLRVIFDLLHNQGVIQAETIEQVSHLNVISFSKSKTKGTDLFNQLTGVIKKVEFLPEESKDGLVKSIIDSGVLFFEQCAVDSYPKRSTLHWKLMGKLVNVLNKQNLLIRLIILFSDILNDNNWCKNEKLSITFWLEEIFKGLASHRHKNLDISEGFTFKESVSETVYLELEGLFNKIFRNFDPILFTSFKCFMLIWRGHFDDYVAEYYQNMMDILSGNCQDLEIEIDFNNIYGFNREVKDTVKKRWVLEPNDMGYEHCAIGVLPYR